MGLENISNRVIVSIKTAALDVLSETTPRRVFLRLRAPVFLLVAFYLPFLYPEANRHKENYWLENKVQSKLSSATPASTRVSNEAERDIDLIGRRVPDGKGAGIGVRVSKKKNGYEESVEYYAEGEVPGEDLLGRLEKQISATTNSVLNWFGGDSHSSE